jgi:hypothetical protein
MNIRKSISLITIFIFSFVICIACALNVAKAQVRGDYPICIDGDCETEVDTSEGTDATAAMPIRGADWFQTQSTTSGWGATLTQASYGPDAGYGETGQIYEYSDPLTGTSVSYKVTGMGMGTIPLPVYGGMFSALGSQSYGPYAYGNQPVTQPTVGYDTQSSQAGNAFGQGYEYSISRPNITSMVGTSLLSNPFTMGSGLALAAMSGAFSGYGASSFGVPSYGGYAGYGGYGVPSYGGYGGYGGYSVPSYGGYAGSSSAYGYPQSAYTGGYGYPTSFTGGYNTSYPQYY